MIPFALVKQVSGGIVNASIAERDDPPLGTFYEVHGRRLLLYRSGKGATPVVFLAGAGAVGFDYLGLQKAAAELTTSVLYDRAGTGWSDSIKLGRSALEVVDELRELLRVSAIPGPYLFVGHSLGGLYARRFAQLFPDEVSGLVLLDPAHEDYDSYMPEKLNEMRKPFIRKQGNRFLNHLMGRAVRSALGRGIILRLPVVRRYRDLYRRLFRQEMNDWPADIRDLLVERHVSLEWLWAGMQEVQNVYDLYDEVRAAGPLRRDIPLIILCSTEIDEFRRAVTMGESESLMQEEIEGKRRLYDAFAATVTRGDNRLVNGGHFTIYLRSPDAVLQAIKDLLGGKPGAANPVSVPHPAA